MSDVDLTHGISDLATAMAGEASAERTKLEQRMERHEFVQELRRRVEKELAIARANEDTSRE